MHIKELILKTASVKDTLRFYSETLELERVDEKENSVAFKAGETTLVFKELQGKKPVYHFAFNIANNKFITCFERVKAKVAILPLNDNLIVKYDNWKAESFYFYDNNENIVECITRYPLASYAEEDS